MSLHITSQATLKNSDIRSTLHLDHILISPALAEELGDKGEVLGSPKPLEFDDAGRLVTRCPG